MLDFLHIENIAVAKNVDINFSDGFNVLTGETGAGKSIIIDSINLLLGAKASKDIIRYGEKHAVIYALFSGISDRIYEICDEYEIIYDRDDMFSLSRTLTSDGKNIIKINSRTATLVQLKAVGPELINIHGQNENQSFMNKANQTSMLDEYIHCDDYLKKYSELYIRLNKLKTEIYSLNEMNKQKEMMLDILKFQIKEINAAKLKDIDEEEKLIALRNRLRESEKIIKQSSNVYRALLNNDSGISAVVLIDKAIDALKRLSEIEPDADELAEKLTSYKYDITDIAERVHEFGGFDGAESPEKQLESIENRLATIQRLERKYGSDVAHVIQFGKTAEEKLKELENSAERTEELKSEYKKLYMEAVQIAEKIHLIRKDGAAKLGKTVNEVLEFLDMPKVVFEIFVNKYEKDGKITLTQSGLDNVEFMISTNVGEELAPMSKIASGGELSRIILALKSALSYKNGAQTVIFDEIDTGVSGSTSQKIGIKLAKIARNTQIICVTHSAQIASIANNHFLIRKTELDGRAEASVHLLDEKERIDEIARIIGGINVTERQYAAACDLIRQAEEYKD